jgi:peroxiredoxin Q/BCP
MERSGLENMEVPMNEKILSIGDMAPDFELPGDAGKKVKLSDFRGRRVILYFYPKDFTSGCTTQACGFRDNFARIEEKNAVVLGVSPDDVSSHRGFREKYRLPFPLLADTDHRVAASYGVWRSGLPLPGVIRSHFVIDENGRITDAQVNVSPNDSVERAMKTIGATTKAGR